MTLLLGQRRAPWHGCGQALAGGGRRAAGPAFNYAAALGGRLGWHRLLTCWLPSCIATTSWWGRGCDDLDPSLL